MQHRINIPLFGGQDHSLGPDYLLQDAQGRRLWGKKRIKNRYLRIALAGLLIVLLAALFRTGDYLGAEDEYHRKCI